ncbi:hypothetical protein BKA80DRAFT_273344 [Phyllosticta citrichinensis]
MLLMCNRFRFAGCSECREAGWKTQALKKWLVGAACVVTGGRICDRAAAEAGVSAQQETKARRTLSRRTSQRASQGGAEDENHKSAACHQRHQRNKGRN